QTKRGVTIFMSTHSLSIAEEVAERIGIIHHGQLLYDGDVEGLRATSEATDLEDVFLSLTEG
ncbi:MAG: ABC transporter ATP-binding protein, partial [Planctomycetes bacterium]|nr:ABC transporter ATP-binding protein [Planctomycetota bacterium]